MRASDGPTLGHGMPNAQPGDTMAQVFIHNIPHRTRQAFMDEWDVPVDVVRGYTSWNIWKQRAQGWDLQGTDPSSLDS